MTETESKDWLSHPSVFISHQTMGNTFWDSKFLIFTQRFSVGHFWSPHHTITEGIFCKLLINAEISISYKYWLSISSKSLIITQLAQFGPQNTTTTELRLRVPNKMQVLENQTLAFFFFLFSPRLHHQIGFFGGKIDIFLHLVHKNRHFHGQTHLFELLVHKNPSFYGQKQDNVLDKVTYLVVMQL